MEVDVESLDTFNQLAHEGAKAATKSMTQLTGIDASVEVTQISLIDRTDLGAALGDDTEFVGVEFGFDGPIHGQTVLIFEQVQSEAIVEALLPADADERMAQSSVKEVGNMMMSGFIDGWAEFLDTTINHTPPTYIEPTGSDVVDANSHAGDNDQLFVFKSEIQWESKDLSFYIYMIPEYSPIASLLAEHTSTADDTIPIQKLTAFNEMTQRGTQKAAENIEMMAGIATDAEVVQISFAPIEDIPKQYDDKLYIGTAVEYTGPPSGFLLVLFDEPSAITVAEGLMPVESPSGDLTDHHQSAIEELGNIVTSGFIDGWANVLQKTIDHTPPRLVHDMGRALIDPLVAQLGQHQQHAFTIEAKMATEEVAFECQIQALPDERELRKALEDLAVDRTDETEADVNQIFHQ